jgi:hypothetical protein
VLAHSARPQGIDIVSVLIYAHPELQGLYRSGLPYPLTQIPDGVQLGCGFKGEPGHIATFVQLNRRQFPVLHNTLLGVMAQRHYLSAFASTNNVHHTPEHLLFWMKNCYELILGIIQIEIGIGIEIVCMHRYRKPACALAGMWVCICRPHLTGIAETIHL